MNKAFLDYLFTKNILVGNENTCDDSFEVLFSLARFFGIRVTKGHEYATLDTIKFVQEQLSSHAVSKVFYSGFPKSVLELTKDEYLFDQIFSYYKTYGLGLFSNPTHSIMEEAFIRTAFTEKTKEVRFEILNEKEALVKLTELIENLLTSTRPLSKSQYELVLAYKLEYNYKVLESGSKDTILKLLVDTKDYDLCSLISLSDVVKLVDYINYTNYNKTKLNNLNLKNRDRVFITKILDQIFDDGYINIKECFEKKQIWCGLLHHIHYKPKTVIAVEFVNLMRGNTNESAYSEFERHMLDNDIRGAVNSIIKNKGTTVLLRKLNYILSRCNNDEDLDYIINNLSSDNVIVLIQLLQNYSLYNKNQRRTFTFVKYNMLKAHTETEEEYNSSKSMLNDEIVIKLIDRLSENLKKALKGRVGKVYVSENMKNIALPIQEATSNGGYGSLTKGSIIPLPKDKKIRAFTYWEKVNDIDLSAIGICLDGSQIEFSWRTMYDKNSECIVYSGDQTSGYNGGAEYYDVDIDLIKKKYNKLKYIVFCNNVYSMLKFSSVECKAGYMLRDKIDSGEIFEPKTISSSFKIDCDSTFAYLFGIDLEKNAFVWLNCSNAANSQVAGTNTINYLAKYFKATEIINYYTLFEMMADELVDDPSLADIVVTDDEYSVLENQELIRSYDFEKILTYLNKKNGS